MIQPWKMIFITLIITGTLITISSPSWMGMWMGLEMNLMGIIPILITEKNSRYSEASLKYFLVQALSSSILIFAFISSSSMGAMKEMMNEPLMTLIMTSMLIKSGIAPFHFWVPPVSEGLKYQDLFIILTWQKIAPLTVISYMMPEFNVMILMISILLSVYLGAMGGFNQTSNRKILAYSSIAHSGWMIAAITTSMKTWITYLALYSMVFLTLINILMKFNINKISQNLLMSKTSKITMFISILSLGGMPPLLGFFPKLLIISTFSLTNALLIYTMMMCALVTLYYYLRMTYSMLMIKSTSLKTNINSSISANNMMMNIIPVMIMPLLFL